MTAAHDDPTVVAHRGFAGTFPENTVGAAIAAAANGAEMIEVDAMPCADGEVVVFHDDRLGDRGESRAITDGSGVVWETPCETVREATVLGTDQTVPTLAEMLEAIPRHVGVCVELKNPGSHSIRPGEAFEPGERRRRREVWAPFVERTVGVVSETDHEILLSSFCEGAIAAARDVVPDVPVAVIAGSSIPDGLEIARRYDCEAIHPHLDAIDPGPSGGASIAGTARTTGDRDLVSVGHEMGADVTPWTVERWHQADRLRRAGVDGIIADYPGLLDFVRDRSG